MAGGANNPFNIRYNPNNQWEGQIGQTGGFADFETLRHGIRAGDITMENYGELYGINTLEGAISRWAPPSDRNPTRNYIDFVSSRTGIAPNQQLDLNDPSLRANILSAMADFENAGNNNVAADAIRQSRTSVPVEDGPQSVDRSETFEEFLDDVNYLRSIGNLFIGDEEGAIAAAERAQMNKEPEQSRDYASTQVASRPTQVVSRPPQAVSRPVLSPSRRARLSESELGQQLNFGGRAAYREEVLSQPGVINIPEPDEPLVVAPENLRESFRRGLGSGLQGIRADVNYLRSIGNLFIGDEEGAIAAAERAQMNKEQAGEITAGSETFEEFLDEPTFGGFMHQVFQTVGMVTPFAAETIATALTGGVAGVGLKLGLNASGRATAKKVVKDLVTKKSKDKVERELLEDLYTVARRNYFEGVGKYAKRGGVAGAFAGEYPIMAGEHFGEFDEAGVDLNISRALQAMGMAFPSAAVGVAGESMLLSRIGRNFSKVAAQKAAGDTSGLLATLAKSVGGGAARQAITEGTTETIQEGMLIGQRMATDKEYAKQDAQMRLGHSAFAGAVAGGFTGGTGGVLTSIPAAFRSGRDTSKNVKDKVIKLVGGARQGQVDAQVDSEQYGTDGYTSAPEAQRDINAQKRSVERGVKPAFWQEDATNENNLVDREIYRGSDGLYYTHIEGRGTLGAKNETVIKNFLRDYEAEVGNAESVLAAALGYSAVKPDGATIVVQIKDKNTDDIISEELTDDAGFDAAVEAARKIAQKDDTLFIETTSLQDALLKRNERVKAEEADAVITREMQLEAWQEAKLQATVAIAAEKYKTLIDEGKTEEKATQASRDFLVSRGLTGNDLENAVYFSKNEDALARAIESGKPLKNRKTTKPEAKAATTGGRIERARFRPEETIEEDITRMLARFQALDIDRFDGMTDEQIKEAKEGDPKSYKLGPDNWTGHQNESALRADYRNLEKELDRIDKEYARQRTTRVDENPDIRKGATVDVVFTPEENPDIMEDLKYQQTEFISEEAVITEETEKYLKKPSAVLQKRKERKRNFVDKDDSTKTLRAKFEQIWNEGNPIDWHNVAAGDIANATLRKAIALVEQYKLDPASVSIVEAPIVDEAGKDTGIKGYKVSIQTNPDMKFYQDERGNKLPLLMFLESEINRAAKIYGKRGSKSDLRYKKIQIVFPDGRTERVNLADLVAAGKRMNQTDFGQQFEEGGAIRSAAAGFHAIMTHLLSNNYRIQLPDGKPLSTMIAGVGALRTNEVQLQKGGVYYETFYNKKTGKKEKRRIPYIRAVRKNINKAAKNISVTKDGSVTLFQVLEALSVTSRKRVFEAERVTITYKKDKETVVFYDGIPTQTVVKEGNPELTKQIKRIDAEINETTRELNNIEDTPTPTPKRNMTGSVKETDDLFVQIMKWGGIDYDTAVSEGLIDDSPGVRFRDNQPDGHKSNRYLLFKRPKENQGVGKANKPPMTMDDLAEKLIEGGWFSNRMNQTDLFQKPTLVDANDALTLVTDALRKNAQEGELTYNPSVDQTETQQIAENQARHEEDLNSHLNSLEREKSEMLINAAEETYEVGLVNPQEVWAFIEEKQAELEKKEGKKGTYRRKPAPPSKTAEARIKDADRLRDKVKNHEYTLTPQEKTTLDFYLKETNEELREISGFGTETASSRYEIIPETRGVQAEGDAMYDLLANTNSDLLVSDENRQLTEGQLKDQPVTTTAKTPKSERLDATGRTGAFNFTRFVESTLRRLKIDLGPISVKRTSEYFNLDPDALRQKVKSQFPEASEYVVDKTIEKINELQNDPNAKGRYLNQLSLGHLILVDDVNYTNAVELQLTVAHEMGHAFFHNMLQDAINNPKLSEALLAAWEAARDAPDAPQAWKGHLRDKRLGFEEWFADNFSRWAVVAEAKSKPGFTMAAWDQARQGTLKPMSLEAARAAKPENQVESFFARYANKLVEMWTALSIDLKRRFRKNKSSETFSDYLEEVIRQYETPKTEEALFSLYTDQRRRTEQNISDIDREISSLKEDARPTEDKEGVPINKTELKNLESRKTEEESKRNQSFEEYRDQAFARYRKQRGESTGPKFQQKVLVRNISQAVENDQASFSAQVLQKRAKILEKMTEWPIVGNIFNLLRTADGMLRGLKGIKDSNAGKKIADMFEVSAQTMNPKLGMLRKIEAKQEDFKKKITAILGMDRTTPENVEALEEAFSETATAELSDKAKAIRHLLEDTYDNYIAPANTKIKKQSNYFPIVLNLEAIAQDPEAFIQLILDSQPIDPRAAKDAALRAIINGVKPENFHHAVLSGKMTLSWDEYGAAWDSASQRLRDEVTYGKRRSSSERQVTADEDAIRNAVEGLVAQSNGVMEENVDPRQDKDSEFDPSPSVEKAIQLTVNVGRNKLGEGKWVLDPDVALEKYLRSLAYRIEWNRHTKDAKGVDRLKPLLDDLSEEDRAVAVEVINSYLGYNRPMDESFKKVSSWLQTMVAIAFLPFTVFASLSDLAGPLINSKEFGTNWNTFGNAFHEIMATWNGDNIKLAEDINVASAQAATNSWFTQTDSQYMDPTAKMVTEKYFKWTGLEWFTRFSRQFASGMGKAFLLAHAHNIDNNPNSTRYLEQLGLTAADVLAWVRGGHNFTTPEGQKVKAGLQRFVESSILRPNAAQRPLWAADPRFALIWQLKSFFYAFHKTTIHGIFNEMKLRDPAGKGNPINHAALPLLVLTAVATMPLAMVGLELREYTKAGLSFVLPGTRGFADKEEALKYRRTNQMGAWEYTEDIFDRAGFYGIFSIFNGAHRAAGWGQSGLASILGPTAETLDAILRNGIRIDRTFNQRINPIGVHL